MGVTSTIVVTLTALIARVSTDCYFPVEMQGEFMTQWKDSQEIAYTSLSLTYNSVPSWGDCHRRHRENVILRDSTAQGLVCFRCIRIIQRSANVNQVHVRHLNQCFDTEEEALADCPTETEVQQRQVEEIMLYKTRGFYGESSVTQTHCPFGGSWRFSYNNAEEEDRTSGGSCDSETSEAGGCPSEFMLDLKFRNCDFPDFDMSFQCLGHWRGEDGLNYLSLLDTKLPQLGEQPRPRYRCAVYDTDPHSGVTHLALSNDSTCVNQLENHMRGYETLRLERKERKVSTELGHKYPAWVQGDWDKVHIKGSELIYRSAEDLTTYHADAIISPAAGQILARLSTSCGELGYACLALEKRTENILELKIGRVDSKLDVSLCSPEYMDPVPWVTVGKEVVRAPCPLAGTFHGVIPDAEGLCARSSTSCTRPDQMEYQVYNCENSTEVYEDRLYQCYGQFQDGGLVYTFTRRLDLPLQECFVGTTLHSTQHYVMEAGKHCQRGKEPAINGMMMLKEAELICDIGGGQEERSSTSPRPVSPRLLSTRPTAEPTRPEIVHKKHHNHNHQAHRPRPQTTTPPATHLGSGSAHILPQIKLLLLLLVPALCRR